MGNLFNKDWFQQLDAYEQMNENMQARMSNDAQSSTNGKEKPKSRTLTKKLSNLLGDHTSDYQRVYATSSVNSTPINNKILPADFDPRSPSSGIVRTPIYCVSEADNKKAILANMNNKMSSVDDPRSPTNEYNRTPIQHATNDSNMMNESTGSLESSSLILSDSLLQQGKYLI
jgi:hypothetical protein